MGLGATSSLLWNSRLSKWGFGDPDDPEFPDDPSVKTLVSDVRRVGLHYHAEGPHFATLVD
jgi:hypothetical protein